MNRLNRPCSCDAGKRDAREQLEQMNARSDSIAPGIRQPDAAAKNNSAGTEGTSLNMSALTRWNPLKKMEEVQNRLSTLFGRASVGCYRWCHTVTRRRVKVSRGLRACVPSNCSSN